uniref:MULE transposase domain-containing protein n=1 Tax=Amphimedon queenslandica TaxID=400682 RepID=A0A1X7SSA3_AMPQE
MKSLNGDTTTLPSAGSLPRSRQQASDVRRFFVDKDPLFSVMHMCIEGNGPQFVRVVTGAPEPMAVVTFDWTLNDLVRFGTSPDNFSILAVDPTFNLCAFHVTVMTYEHKLLEKVVASSTSSIHPVMLSHIFIHQRKTFATYHFFASQLIGMRPQLRDIKAFGTDDNIKSNHIGDFKVPLSVLHEFIADIFGKATDLQLGLVDSMDEEDLMTKFASLKDTWNKRESDATKAVPKFYSWFLKYCIPVVKSNMLRSLRTAAGLGSPPLPYYKNRVESLNKVLKLHTKYQKHQLPEFIKIMEGLYDAQVKEIEKSLCGIAEYRVLPAYKQHCYEARKWFTMSENQRKAVLRRFMSASTIIPSFESSYSGLSASDNPLSSLPLPHSLQIKFEIMLKICRSLTYVKLLVQSLVGL